jgi:hypothetical protein
MTAHVRAASSAGKNAVMYAIASSTGSNDTDRDRRAFSHRRIAPPGSTNNSARRTSDTHRVWWRVDP